MGERRCGPVADEDAERSEKREVLVSDEVHTFRGRDQARLAVFTFIEGFYNPRRRHSTLGQRSPDRFEETMIKEDTQKAVAVSS